MLAYPESRAAGWQTVTGPADPMCKTPTPRLKGSGMRWSTGNPEAVMALDALNQSGEWKQDLNLRLEPVG
jgi:hypothetical protein